MVQYVVARGSLLRSSISLSAFWLLIFNHRRETFPSASRACFVREPYSFALTLCYLNSRRAVVLGKTSHSLACPAGAPTWAALPLTSLLPGISGPDIRLLSTHRHPETFLNPCQQSSEGH